MTELRDKTNKQYDIRYARVVIISLGKDKVMWRSCAEKRNTNLLKNYGRGNYNNSLCWENVASHRTCKVRWFTFDLKKVYGSSGQWFGLDSGNY